MMRSTDELKGTRNDGKKRSGSSRDVKAAAGAAAAVKGLALPQAKNIRYDIQHQRRLTLFVILQGKEKFTCIATANSITVGDLPVRLNFSVWVLKTPQTKSKQTITDVTDELTAVEPNVMWMLRKDLLHIEIDLSDGPKKCMSSALSHKAPLVSMKRALKLGEYTYRVSMELFGVEGGKWPVLSTPRAISSGSGRSSPMDIHPRELRFSVSPLSVREGSLPAETASMIQLNEFTLLDTTRLPIARLCITMENEDRAVYFDQMLSGIDVSVSVKHVTDDKPLTESAYAVNVAACEESDMDGRACIVIELDISKDYDVVKDGERIISYAGSLCVNSRYLVDLRATRPIAQMPDFAQVCECVNEYLNEMPNVYQNLHMPSVRAVVVKNLGQPAATRELKNMIWEAVRMYIINDFMGVKQRNPPVLSSVVRAL
uniref:Uncharacterized protein TCIL3000_11_8870 n=1 Tax=Trypanosoma congolense (strain IL3000) TaxID=1068625 RepID=G0V1A9_TRYCI|nr:unnamed protein product [Trypanosoma congolense IL3000]